MTVALWASSSFRPPWKDRAQLASSRQKPAREIYVPSGLVRSSEMSGCARRRSTILRLSPLLHSGLRLTGMTQVVLVRMLLRLTRQYAANEFVGIDQRRVFLLGRRRS